MLNKTRTAIYLKEGTVTALTLEVGRFGTVRVCRFDPRTEPAVAQGPWDFFRDAERAFERSKRTSEERGWKLLYEGPPLGG